MATTMLASTHRHKYSSPTTKRANNSEAINPSVTSLRSERHFLVGDHPMAR
jgi:hypothetical protein